VTFVLLLNAKGNTRLDKDLQRWTDQFRAMLDQPGGDEDFRACVAYISVASDTAVEDLHDFSTEWGQTRKKDS
jgi:hypothetical protein